MDNEVVLLGVFVVSILVTVVSVIWASIVLHHTRSVPTAPKGWANYDYDANQANRQSLLAYLGNPSLSDASMNIPMRRFAVATANFGGIFTNEGSLSPYIGTASPEAARLQVEAGARAIVFDIWPDPSAPATPVVCSMEDYTEAALPDRIWASSWGLGRGVGRYSNWKLLTRNTVPASAAIAAAVNAAFQSSNQQAGDPFFLFLKLHGAMNTTYLNTLAAAINTAIGGHAMDSVWAKAQNQTKLCSEPVSSFMGKVFVTVIPEVVPGYFPLPGVTKYSDFVSQLLATNMGDVVNAVEQSAGTIYFDPANLSAVSTDTVSLANCVTNQTTISPAQAGLVLVQPTIGGTSADNDVLFAGTSLQACLQAGAQMVAVNLFSPNDSENQMTAFVDPKLFGTFSFRLNAT
jgi:hypothetical protein